MKKHYLMLAVAAAAALATLLTVMGALGAQKLAPPSVIAVRQLGDRVTDAQEDRAVAIDPVRNYAYVLDRNSVSVFQDLNEIGSLQLGNVQGITVDPVRGYAYVTQKGVGLVVVISATTELGRVNLGPESGSMAILTSTGYLYVTQPGMNEVAVLSRTETVGSGIAVGERPIGIATDAARDRVYVINEGSLSLSIIEGTAVISEVTLPFTPTSVAVNPTTGYVYVGHGQSSKLTILAHDSITATLNLSEPGNIAANPANGKIYVLTSRSILGKGSLSVISGTTVVATSTLEYPLWSIAINPRDNFIYVAHGAGGTGAVTIFSDTQPVERFPMGQTPWDVDINRETNLAYVPNFNGTVVVFGRTPTYDTPPLGPGISYTLHCSGTHDLPVTIEIPAGAVAEEDVVIVCRPLPDAQTLPQYVWAGQAFRIAAYRDGIHLPNFSFSRPVTLTVGYGDEWLGEANEEELLLIGQLGNAAQQYWTEDAVHHLSRSMASNRVVGTITQQAPYAIGGPRSLGLLPVVMQGYKP